MESANYSYTGIIDGHEYVDLGLSVAWATCNVGASSPSNFGDYFAWGETISKNEYTSANSIMIGNINPYLQVDDAATLNWGAPWRCPISWEINELIVKCRWEWDPIRCPKGYKVRGRNGNSIFLPATGVYDGKHLCDVGQKGYYWSFEIYSSISAYILLFNKKRPRLDLRDMRYGLNIRPVIDRKYCENETNE